MPASRLRFGRWLERLGFTDGVEPSVMRAVQPVQVVGDVSHLVSQPIPPGGYVGGVRTAVPAVFAVFEAYGGRRGGIAGTITLSAATGWVSHKLLAAPLVLANLIGMNQTFRYGPATTATFRLGTNATAFTFGAEPIRLAPANSLHTWDFFVPPGAYYYAGSAVANIPIDVDCQFTELEGPNPD